MLATLRLPTTNIHAKGDFTISVAIGSQAIPAHLILDTGSSTLALHSNLYDPEQDSSLIPTTLVQHVNYGIGNWTGPVVQTSVQLAGNATLHLPTNYVALATEGTPTFAKADGIVGLAYARLNQATDICSYLQQLQPTRNASMPWPITASVGSVDITTMLAAYPKKYLTPWFTNLEQHGVIANIFAWYCQRSSIHYAEDTTEPVPDDPLNQGWFILGDNTEQQDLYSGEFQAISVKHDIYYNVQLIAVQVADLPLIKCPAGSATDGANGFFDTGASAILLPDDLYQKLLQHIAEFNPSLSTVLQQIPVFNGIEQGLPASLIHFDHWPTIYFYFAGENGETVKLACPAFDYWQSNAPAFNMCSFKIIAQLPHFAAQCIIGLPLLCNYYTVFDRAVHNNGVIRCAKARR